MVREEKIEGQVRVPSRKFLLYHYFIPLYRLIVPCCLSLIDRGTPGIQYLYDWDSVIIPNIGRLKRGLYIETKLSTVGMSKIPEFEP